MQALQGVILDDERSGRERLAAMLAAREGVEVLAVCRTVAETQSVLRAGRVDVAFLDIRLGDHTGFEVLEGLRTDQRPVVVFVTAHETFGSRAFECGALDYLLKPVDEKRLDQTLERVRVHLRSQRVGLLQELGHLAQRAASNVQDTRRVGIQSKGKIAFVLRDDVIWLKATQGSVEILTTKDTLEVRQALRDVAREFVGGSLVQVNRGLVVSTSRVEELILHPDGAWSISIAGNVVPVGRRYRERVRRALRPDEVARA